MTREDIIRMAKEAGIQDAHSDKPHLGVMAQLERFAALVAAAEREACARLAEEWLGPPTRDKEFYIAAAIRARGQRSDEASKRGETQ
jgi:hypothetical protein